MSDAKDRNLENKSPEELEQEIEETRARISDEMSALGYKLGPEGLKDSAEDALKDTQDTVISVTEQLRKGVVESSDSIGGRITSFIKENPVPATLFGVGLAWLLKQGQASRTSQQAYGGSGGTGGRSYARGNDARSGSNRVYTGGDTENSTSSSNSDDAFVANVPGPGRSGDAKHSSTGSAPARAASDEDDGFRSHFESNFSADGDYETYEPAYRYGFDLASEESFQGKPWRDARSDAKRRWDEERNEPWFRFDQAVEHGYTTAQSRR